MRRGRGGRCRHGVPTYQGRGSRLGELTGRWSGCRRGVVSGPDHRGEGFEGTEVAECGFESLGGGGSVVSSVRPGRWVGCGSGRGCGREGADSGEGVGGPEDDRGVVVGKEGCEAVNRGVQRGKGGAMEGIEGADGIHSGSVRMFWCVSSAFWRVFWLLKGIGGAAARNPGTAVPGFWVARMVRPRPPRRAPWAP